MHREKRESDKEERQSKNQGLFLCFFDKDFLSPASQVSRELFHAG